MNRLILILCLFHTFEALAGLGEHESSVDGDKIRLRANTHLRSQLAHYTVYELGGSVNTVKEFSNSDGKIFAVTWRGVARPNLSQVFGATYYSEFKEADNARPRSRSRAPSRVQTSNVIVEQAPNMRDFRGKAYIPNLVPEGVNIGELE